MGGREGVDELYSLRKSEQKKGGRKMDDRTTG